MGWNRNIVLSIQSHASQIHANVLLLKTCFCSDIERVNLVVGRISYKLCTYLNFFLCIDFQWQMLQIVNTRISNEAIFLLNNDLIHGVYVYL